MINFTTTVSYGLRLLINLANNHKAPKQLKKIALEEGIPLSYLRKLVRPLEKVGMVRSLKGPGGGFMLARRASNIPLLEIISTLSHSKVIGCLKKPDSCERYTNCVVKDLLGDVYAKIEAVFKNKTLETILRRRPA
jgi:Rrf2 family iron-sulfur cluster assembly transcriptional regulator